MLCARSRPAVTGLCLALVSLAGHAAGGEAIEERTLPGRPRLHYLQYVPEGVGSGAPLLVTVHGISRNADAHARAFAPFAASHGAVLVAPQFDDLRFEDYQRLGRSGLGERADLALARLVDHVASETGAAGEAVLLFGYSGGAQFVQRYAMAHPERVAAAVVASPGWYTFPDPARSYPLGIAPSDELPGVRFEPDAFLRVPVLVTVGADDTDRGGSFRKTRRLDWQGRTRVERALRWVDAMRAAAAARGLPERVELVQLDDAAHSFEGNVEKARLAERATTWLFAPARRARVRPRH